MSNRFATMNRQRGFTLSEILVTTAIFAIIMIAALTVYDRSNRVFKNATEAADMQQSTRIAFDKLVSDLRMAGFDYSRGGIPSGPGQFAQPDEQIEYAGTTAVVFRGNFDYNTNAANGNGLATGYSAISTGGGPIFPYVTTDNTEIVAYVLRSTAPGATNPDSISFYADVEVPRRAYPNVSGLTSGGHAENNSTAITISGIDLSNANPPYTLYRVTADDVLNNRTGTPVAENIRSVNFKYYTDGTGTTLLTKAGNVAITQQIDAGNSAAQAGGTAIDATGTGAIGGDGLYDPANIGSTTNFDNRQQRALIQAIRMDLVGMNANPEANFQNPTETNTAFKNYREYSLSSLIVPRNLGKTGFPEPSYNPPGPPEITGGCTGHCAAPYLVWNAPSGGGPVISYEIQWDTDPNGAFNGHMPISDPSARSAIVQDDGAIDPSLLIYYRIVAINDNGVSQPSANFGIAPQNMTKPSAPQGPSAGTFGSSNQANQITLTWRSPTTNATTTMACTGSASTTGANIPSQELIKYQVYRDTNQSFNPDAGEGTMVLDFSTASQPAVVVPGNAVTWVDKGKAAPTDPTQSLAAPASCVQYYYRVRALDRCYTAATRNYSGNINDSISAWYPAVGSPAEGGYATGGTVTPATPSGLALDTATTVCPFAGNACKIGLQWNKVTTDTTGAGVGVDVYTVKRERRIQGTSTFTLDTTYGILGYQDVAGYSSGSSSLATYVDTSALYQDILGGQGLWEYRYSVASKICTTPSPAYSNTVLYPGCAITANVTAATPASGAGSSGSPWVLGYGDSITVSAASGTISSVSFQLKDPGGNNIGSPLLVSASPFTVGWSDQTDGVTYQMWMTITDPTGCQMTLLRFVTQEAAAPCTFQDLGTVGRPGGPPGPSLANSGSQPRPVTYDFSYSAAAINNYAVTNNQPTVATTETMKFIRTAAQPGGAFNGSMTMTWVDNNGKHPELNWLSVDWYKMSSTNTILYGPVNVAVNQTITQTVLTADVTAAATSLPVVSTAAFGAVGTTGTLWVDSEAMLYTIASTTSFTVTRAALGTTAAPHVGTGTNPGPQEVLKLMVTTVNAPATFPDVAANESIRLILNMTYDSSHKATALTITGSEIKKMCFAYKVLSDPTRIQRCNLVGRAATTANPGACD